MNEKTSWDQSLIKKYSSSNHLKMLNQLRSEVKKYPLNKKKNLTSIKSNEIKNEIKNKGISGKSQDISFIDKSHLPKEINNSHSTVSFNNSKDFSIYNSKINDQKNDIQDNKFMNTKTSDELNSSSTFKDRLNQIDLK